MASSRDSILARWYDSAFRSSAIVALVMFVVGLFGWVFIRQVRVGERVEADLRQAQHSGRNRAAVLSMEGGVEALMRSDR